MQSDADNDQVLIASAVTLKRNQIRNARISGRSTAEVRYSPGGLTSDHNLLTINGIFTGFPNEITGAGEFAWLIPETTFEAGV